MNEIPRYELKLSEPIGFEVMTEVHNGRFVRHLDYLKVLEQNNRLDADVAGLTQALKDTTDELTETKRLLNAALHGKMH